jgi:hypothetical protein
MFAVQNVACSPFVHTSNLQQVADQIFVSLAAVINCTVRAARNCLPEVSCLVGCDAVSLDE